MLNENKRYERFAHAMSLIYCIGRHNCKTDRLNNTREKDDKNIIKDRHNNGSVQFCYLYLCLPLFLPLKSTNMPYLSISFTFKCLIMI